MDNTFEIPLSYDGDEYLFNAELVAYAHSYKIVADVFGHAIIFEPDEEQRYRAIVAPDDLAETAQVERELLAAIANKLWELFNS
jgi:hypothetical protein